MNPRSCNADKSRQGEEGYVLLVLLLVVALLSISFLGVIQNIAFEIRRDREEEMIHRGVQYSRAVRKFVNVFRRYPFSIEELENTNNIRCLRKRYKDPITGKDFKLLHLSDMPGFISTTGAGVPVASLAQQQGALGTSGNVAATTGGPGSFSAGVQSSEPILQTENFGGSPDNQGDVSQTDQNGSSMSATTTPPQPVAPQLAPNITSKPGKGLIIGVASASGRKTIREFNKKDRYNQWLFIYDPSTQNAGLIMTPSQPALGVGLQRSQQQSGDAATPASGLDSGLSSTPPGSASGPQ